MNKNERPSFLKGKGAAVGVVICFVAVIALVGAYTFRNYQRDIDEQMAKAEEQAEKLTEDMVTSLEMLMEKTKTCTGMTLLLAFNYGAKKELVDCIKKIVDQVVTCKISLDDISEQTIEENLYTKDIPPVDFLIRTSGEIRVSNFLLWQIAYAEMYFTKILWPDFHAKELYEAIYEYQQRHRRYGGLEKKI